MSYYGQDLICKCGGELLSGICLLKCGDCGRFWLEVQEWMRPNYHPVAREFSPAQQAIIDADKEEAAIAKAEGR